MVAGEKFCHGDWLKIKKKYSSFNEGELLLFCFSSAYIIALLHDTLKMPLEHKRWSLFVQFYSLFQTWIFTLVMFQDWCCKSNPWCACWLGIGCFHCANDDEPDRVLRLISFISKQLWLFWLGTNFLDYNCGCIYSILHPEVEKASAEDDLRHGERPVHHNQGQPMSFARRRWEWVNLLQRSTSDRECRFS